MPLQSTVKSAAPDATPATLGYLAPGLPQQQATPVCHVTVLTDPKEVWDIQPAWEALWRRANGTYAQAFVTCRAAWRHMAAAKGGRLRVMACFDDGRLVALWPLIASRSGAWRVLRQLGPQAAEYSDMLVEASPHAGAYAAAIWREVRSGRHGDLIVLPFVKQDARLQPLLDRAADARAGQSTVAPYINWRDGESWHDYYGRLQPKGRKEQNRKRRHFHALGSVRFAAVTEPAGMPALIDWILHEKRFWAAQAGKSGVWLNDLRYRDFLVDAVTARDAAAAFVMFVLTLDDVPVAAKLAMAGPHRIDAIIAGFSHDHARYAPGVVLDEYCQSYAHERGLHVDFGAGPEMGKLFWSQGQAHSATTYRVALTRWGAAGERLRGMREAARGKWRHLPL
jgi:CelD/BcsL family acetyltransferase involved in cellulose biosynthesis